MEPIIVSYFTKGTFYEKEAERLRASCERFGLEYRIEGIEPFGKWHEHTCYKPTYILQKMEELKRPIVWIDADAEIVKRPRFDFDCDIALRICDFYPSDHPSYLYAGTIYINNNDAALDFVKRWAATCQKALKDQFFTVDQQVLGWELQKRSIRVLPLPIGYVAIFEEDMPEEEKFIIHYQASRLYKKIIDGDLQLGFLDHLDVDELRKMRPKVSRK